MNNPPSRGVNKAHASRLVYEVRVGRWRGRVRREPSPIGVLWWASVIKTGAHYGYTCPFKTRREAIAWCDERVSQ